ncbi:MAG TPA: GGDEF domain-containing protein, partial [Bacillota bacterium]|nr:GGDEF domain-containing protein [Bacillota bacterium]
IPIRCSIGACGIEALAPIEKIQTGSIPPSYFEQMAKLLIRTADEMLYRAKQSGRNCYRVGTSIKWLGFSEGNTN